MRSRGSVALALALWLACGAGAYLAAVWFQYATDPFMGKFGFSGGSFWCLLLWAGLFAGIVVLAARLRHPLVVAWSGLIVCYIAARTVFRYSVSDDFVPSQNLAKWFDHDSGYPMWFRVMMPAVYAAPLAAWVIAVVRRGVTRGRRNAA
jgi:hypothetical protein